MIVRLRVNRLFWYRVIGFFYVRWLGKVLVSIFLYLGRDLSEIRVRIVWRLEKKKS